MAIRPVDLQLAYLAAPQNAAQASATQNASQAAQQAAQAAFVAQLEKREESVAAAAGSEGPNVETDPDGRGDGQGYTPDQDKRRTYEADESMFASGDEHFIDIVV